MEEGLGNVNRRVSLLKDALRMVDELLTMIPKRKEVLKTWPDLRHEQGYFDNGMIQRGTEKLFLMGPPLVDGPKYTKLTQCLADRLNQCELQFHDTYNLPSEMIGEARLIKEPVWRACMEGLKMTLDWELKEAEAARNATGSPDAEVNPPDTSLVSADQSGAFARAGDKVPDAYKHDGRECGPLEGGKTELAKVVTKNRKAKPEDLEKHHCGKVFVREISKRKLEVFFRSFKELNDAKAMLTPANSE